MLTSPQHFEAAADAIVNGNLDTLTSLLTQEPELLRARSARQHGAALLHYVAANGVEEFRQKTPGNIVQVTDYLLTTGADVHATANLYGGHSTTLRLAATSIHPQIAGVLESLLDHLLGRGANINEPLLVTACLSNGRLQGAQYLAKRGASLNLAEAAGLGKLDLVKTLRPCATRDQLATGFLFACQYGHNEVIDLLAQSGVDLTVTTPDRQSGLHCAVIGGKLETVELLLKYKLPLEATNNYGGTVLGQAIWSSEHTHDSHAYQEIIARLVSAGAKC